MVHAARAAAARHGPAVVSAALLAVALAWVPGADARAQTGPQSEIFVPTVKAAPPPPAAAAPPQKTVRQPSEATAAPTRIFAQPKLGGYWVDRCLSWGAQCNQPAADEFCRRKGYARASDFQWASMAPTRILSSGQVCNLPICGGFVRVTCQR